MSVGHTTGSLAGALGAQLVGPADLPISSIDTLTEAGPGAITFIRSIEFASRWAGSKAAAALVSRGLAVPGHDPSRRALLIVEDADLALIKALSLFAPAPAAPPPGVHATAFVDPSAVLGKGVSVGPGGAVGAGARLGDGVRLGANVSIGAGVTIGDGSCVHAGAVVMDRCRIGRRCTIWPGVVIGADGFGYRPAPDGRGVVKVPHIGTVEIGDDVDVGANSCIDRGKFGATRIGDGTKIDNLVQIAHNCVIGRACLICGQAALAGSVTLGDGVILGGQVGIADNVSIGAGTMIGAQSGVMNDLPAGGMYLGTPVLPRADTARLWATQRTLPDVIRRLKREGRDVGAAKDGP